MWLVIASESFPRRIAETAKSAPAKVAAAQCLCMNPNANDEAARLKRV